MSKLSRMTHITPLPAGVSREAAIAYLHNHHSMIELNPLVLRHERCEAHSNAPDDEVESMTWYEITDMIQYIPGTPIKGEVSYKAGFYDTATGLQTHTFAPGGVEIRGKWHIGGNAPGEKREDIEIGSNKPREGLYIQEDVDLRCNILMTGFVKKNLKKSHATVADKIAEAASSAAVSRTSTQQSEQQQRPVEHARSNSGLSASKERDKSTRPKRPSDAGGSASTPTSYTQASSSGCSCPMAAFGVHMVECQFYPQPRNSRTPEPQPQVNNVTAELDGDSVKAQKYSAYSGGRAAELE